MKKIIYALLLCLLGLSAYAQQEPHFTHFMYTQQTINPAYVGTREVPSFLVLYRNQWLDIEGAPRNMMVSFSSPFLGDKVGFGITAIRQQVGIFDNWHGSLAYSYRLQLSENLNLRIGLHGAGYYSTFNFSKPGTVYFDENDPSIPLENTTLLKGNFGAGLYVYNKSFYFGLSSPYFLSNQIGFNDQSTTTAVSQAHYYAMAGTVFPINDKVKLRPAILGKYVQGAPFQAEVNISAMFSNKVSAGVSYRSGGSGVGESVDFLLFFQLTRRAGFGMAYDFTLSDIQPYNNGTFEVMLRFDTKGMRDDLENPRFLF